MANLCRLMLRSTSEPPAPSLTLLLPLDISWQKKEHTTTTHIKLHPAEPVPTCRKMCSPKHPVIIGKLGHKLLTALYNSSFQPFCIGYTFYVSPLVFRISNLSCLPKSKRQTMPQLRPQLICTEHIYIVTLLIHTEWDGGGRGAPEDESKEGGRVALEDALSTIMLPHPISLLVLFHYTLFRTCFPFVSGIRFFFRSFC